MNNIEDEISDKAHKNNIKEFEDIIDTIKKKSKSSTYEVKDSDLGKLVIEINDKLQSHPNLKTLIKESFGCTKVNINMEKELLVTIQLAIEEDIRKGFTKTIISNHYNNILTGIEKICKQYIKKDISFITNVYKNDIYIQAVLNEILSKIELFSFFKSNTEINVYIRLVIVLIIPIFTAFIYNFIGSNPLSFMLDQLKANLVKSEFLTEIKQNNANNADIITEKYRDNNIIFDKDKLEDVDL